MLNTMVQVSKSYKLSYDYFNACTLVDFRKITIKFCIKLYKSEQ